VARSDLCKTLHPLPDRVFSELLSTCCLRSCAERLHQQRFADLHVVKSDAGADAAAAAADAVCIAEFPAVTMYNHLCTKCDVSSFITRVGFWRLITVLSLGLDVEEMSLVATRFSVVL